MIKDITMTLLNEEKVKLEQLEASLIQEMLQNSLLKNSQKVVKSTYHLKVIEKKLNIVRKMQSLYVDKNYISKTPITVKLDHKSLLNAPSQVKKSFIEVVEDPDKATTLANLLTTYGDACKNQENNVVPLELNEQLPQALKQALTKQSYFYNVKTGMLKDPDELLSIIKKYKGEFEIVREEYEEEFTLEKLEGLTHIDNLDDIISFLNLHKFKFDRNDLDTLQRQDSIIIREKIEEAIWAWYETYPRQVLGINHSLSKENISLSLETQRKDIFLSLKAMEDMIKRILASKKELLKKNAEMERIKTMFESKIKDLTNGEFTPASLPYVFGNYKDNMTSILNIFVNEYENDLTNRININLQEVLNEEEEDIPSRKRTIKKEE